MHHVEKSEHNSRYCASALNVRPNTLDLGRLNRGWPGGHRAGSRPPHHRARSAPRAASPEVLTAPMVGLMCAEGFSQCLRPAAAQTDQ